MLKQATRTLAIMAFTTLMGCSNAIMPTAPPDLDATHLALHHTPNTQVLTSNLLLAYQEQQAIRFTQSGSTYLSTLEQLGSSIKPYAIASYLPHESDLWAVPIAQDGLAIVLHPDNPLHALTAEQLRRVYRGFITNWHELGGADQPIRLYAPEATSEMHLIFEELVMGQQRLSPNTQVLPDNDSILQKVSQEVGAISYLPLTQLTEAVRAISLDSVEPTRQAVRESRYALRYTIYFIAPQEPEDPYKDFIAWAQSDAGQAIVAQGAIPLLD